MRVFPRRPGTGWRCRLACARMPLHYYALLGDRAGRVLERHLKECRACTVRWSEMRRILGAVDARAAFPRESEVDWSRFARDTVARARASAARAEAGGAGAFRAAPRLPAWAFRGSLAAAGLLVMAFVALLISRLGQEGRQVPEPSAAASGAASESTRILQVNLARQGAARYLRDGRSLLVGLVQAKVPCRRAGGEFDITLEKEQSQELLRRKNLYAGALGGMQDRRLADLVAQLESVLLQVSSLGDCAAVRQIHDLRAEIEKRRLLLRIDLLTREVEGRRFRA